MSHLAGCSGLFTGVGDCPCESQYRLRSAGLLLRAQLAEEVCEAVLEAQENGLVIIGPIAKKLKAWQSETGRQVAEAFARFKETHR